MGRIEVYGIKAYGHHGCLEEEGIIGQEYSVDVSIECNITPSALTDDLQKTVDYCLVTEIVKEEIGRRSNLIETVAHRIAVRLKEIDMVEGVEVKVTKPKPPIQGDVREVSVIETL